MSRRTSVLALAVLAMLGACSSSPSTPQRPGSELPTRGSPAPHPSGTSGLRPAPRPTPSPATLPLSGRTVVIDPGHNGGNASNPAFINTPVPAGGFDKPCDTTGTETDDGYPEYAFTLDVAERAQTLLQRLGARVVLTRTSSNGAGPCVNVRAAIGNDARADAASSIHADGGPATGTGFHVIEPSLAPDGGNAAILAPSARLALDVRAAFAEATAEPFADYVAQQGLIARNDLGGLNLSRVPKVFIECANMRGAADALRVKDPSWREKAAEGIADGIARFLEG